MLMCVDPHFSPSDHQEGVVFIQWEGRQGCPLSHLRGPTRAAPVLGWDVGEGIEKKVDDFAAEVAAQMANK